MGQRHQIYAAFRPGNKGKFAVVGAHHQWLYGRTAVQQASRVMQLMSGLFSKGREDRADYDHYNPFWTKQTAHRTLDSLYSFIPEDGYYSGVVLFYGDQDNGETKDPRRGDNNDGITVFDFRDMSNLGYCFMRLPNDGDTTISKATGGVPMSAREYMSLYYSLRDGMALGQYEEYILKHAESKRQKAKAWRWIKDNRAECRNMLRKFNKWRVMSEADCLKIFPAMFAPPVEVAEMEAVGDPT